MFCQYCGKPLPNGAEICPSCQRPLPKMPQKKKPQSKTKGILIACISILTVLLIAITAATIWLTIHNSGKDVSVNADSDDWYEQPDIPEEKHLSGDAEDLETGEASEEHGENKMNLNDIFSINKPDYYEFIRDNLLPEMGYASLADSSRTVTSEGSQAAAGWDQRFGLAGADIADLNNDGVDDLLVYYMTENMEQTYTYEQTGWYLMSFYVDLYTIQENEIIKVASVPISRGSQTAYEYLRLGLMEIDGRTYLYVESMDEAYFADGFDVSYQWYEYGDSGAFLPRWNVCKSDGGSSDIAYSLYTCTSGLDHAGEAEEYEKTLIWGDTPFLLYSWEGPEPLLSADYYYDRSEVMLRGFEEMNNIPITSAYGGMIYSDKMPTYWTEEYLKPSVSYTCEGTPDNTYFSWDITVSLKDLTELQEHMKESE